MGVTLTILRAYDNAEDVWKDVQSLEAVNLPANTSIDGTQIIWATQDVPANSHVWVDVNILV